MEMEENAMVEISNYFGRYPCEPNEKKPVHITREKMILYIYTPEKPHMSDLNWLFATTEVMFSGAYLLAPGSSFDPPDVHDGDEYYYVLSGTFTMLNPSTGHVTEIHKGEAINLPRGALHKAYNFGTEAAKVIYLIAPRAWPKGVTGPPEFDDSQMKLLK
jgi:mannose-6-phosphate isomerase-like protein (cupin superfamily)